MIQPSARDVLHFSRMWLRNKLRQRTWEKNFKRAIAEGHHTVPHATVVQLIPTEACNLRCAMCNQWGDNGYFKNGIRKVEHMDPSAMRSLLAQVDPRDSLISVHGGEPFAYKHIGQLFELLAAGDYDVMVSTNGTLISKHVQSLAKVKNLSLLLSIDGDEQRHDAIRGEGRFRQAQEQVEELCRLRKDLGLPMPFIVMSLVVCEWNADALSGAVEVARSFGAFIVNYNMRWFLAEEVGEAYETHLKEQFNTTSTGAWRGWISEAADHDYKPAAKTMGEIMRKQRWNLKPPYVMTTPSQLRGSDFYRYFADYMEVFGNESCFMPYYWARIHANGDLIFCPGHPDLISGNVFRDGYKKALNSALAIKLRKEVLQNRLPICNRCCGLYMTNTARGNEERVRKELGMRPAVQSPYL